MSELHRRKVLRGAGLLLAGSVAGCSGLLRQSGSGLPDRVPLHARNERDEHVSLAYWCFTTASVPDERDIDGVAELNSGEEARLTEIPVDASGEDADLTSSREAGNPGERPTPGKRSPGSNIGITADLQHRDDQRNVLLHVDPESDAFSKAGYLITVLSEPIRDVGTPDQPVSHESVSSDESVAADVIRIAPRPDEE